MAISKMEIATAHGASVTCGCTGQDDGALDIKNIKKLGKPIYKASQAFYIYQLSKMS